MGLKKQYAQFLSELDEVPIFIEPWYLNAACGEEKWDVALVDENGAVQAAMPYYHPDHDTITMPPLTQVMGPIVRPRKQKCERAMAREKKLFGEIIRQLPSVKVFRQDFSPATVNWLPFYWAGFQETTRYTYRIEDLSDLDGIWEQMRSELRGMIRKSKKLGIQIEPTDDFDLFLKIVDKTFSRQGIKNPLRNQAVRRIYEASVRRDQGQLFFARDQDGRVHAASYLVWNGWCAYNLAGGADPELRKSGANNHILWALVEFARGRSAVFDFEGSMLEGVELVCRSFGAIQRPYFRISRDGRGQLERWKSAVGSNVKSGLRRCQRIVGRRS